MRWSASVPSRPVDENSGPDGSKRFRPHLADRRKLWRAPLS
ncbi:hypothetical protein STRIP9103_08821 [Streptomyces ipomoeae 91-03]|uniref:Uncharacterized protein n=1 Tax=Streptomyces ipomoeae 91-03 TaxID=698759 RepID=L1KWE1_9ACTN|nr:hypothetical protein STRIP9103_08821 [Streptomyces ipomoeae 91-03]